MAGWQGQLGTDWRGHLLSKQVDSFLTERLVLAGVLIRFPPTTTTTTTMSADQGGGGRAGREPDPTTHHFGDPTDIRVAVCIGTERRLE